MASPQDIRPDSVPPNQANPNQASFQDAGSQASSPAGDSDAGAQGDSRWSASSGGGAAAPSTADLLAQLGEDRLWLLRQIDSGLWSEWRLDLAALERELGQLLDQAAERL
jgi:hypothetical protein